MKFETKKVDEANGTVRITTESERWYFHKEKYYPSVTWLCDFYPKGIEFYRWLASKGWAEAESIKEIAGNKGSKVHQGINALLKGEEVLFNSNFNGEELTAIEYEAIISFCAFWREQKDIRLLSTEQVLINERHGYAGTMDILCEIAGEKVLIDLKTSPNIYMSHELQVSAYAHCFEEPPKTAILQVGYRKNKKRFKLTETEDRYSLFLNVKKIWEVETAGMAPLQKDYPLKLKLEGLTNGNS